MKVDFVFPSDIFTVHTYGVMIAIGVIFVCGDGIL